MTCSMREYSVSSLDQQQHLGKGSINAQLRASPPDQLSQNLLFNRTPVNCVLIQLGEALLWREGSRHLLPRGLSCPVPAALRRVASLFLGFQ